MADLPEEMAFLSRLGHRQRLAQRDFTVLSHASDALIAEMGDEAFNRVVQQAAAQRWPDYDPTEYLWALDPMEDRPCTSCYQWQRYPSGQRQFGFAWWRHCPHTCTCAHHASEQWLGHESTLVAYGIYRRPPEEP